MPGLMELLFGSGDKTSQLSTLDPNQQQALQGILGQLGSMSGGGGAYSGAQNYLSSLLSGDPNAFAQFEAPYRQEFESKTVPMLAERFAGLSPMGGGLSSSGFGQALGGAGAQLQSQLAGLHGQLRQGAAGQAMGQFNNLAGLGLGTRSFENMYQPGSTGLVGGALQGLGSGVGMGLGMAGGGAMGQGVGALMGLLKGLFK
jgi:hypothetical protein